MRRQQQGCPRSIGTAGVTNRTAGVDEAGRGALAGPVVVAAVILDPARPISGLDDSKRLTANRRTDLCKIIIDRVRAYSIVSIDPATIDRINILQATLLGMKQAVEQLDPVPDLALIDGNRAPELTIPCRTIIKGDQLEACISAASILAKVSRDRYMQEQHQRFPCYGFDHNKGYPTPDHLQALPQHGPCEIHRQSFGPVRQQVFLF